MEDRIKKHMKGTKIITEKLYRTSTMNSNMAQQESDPSEFSNGGCHGQIFFFRTRLSNRVLFFGALGNIICSEKEGKTSSTSSC